jgi:hypothetical protein
MWVGDYRRFRPKIVQIWSLETAHQSAKARNWRAFLRCARAQSPVDGLAGWGGRIRASIWQIGNQMLSPDQGESQDRLRLRFLTASKYWNFEKRTKSAESRASEINGHFGEY